MRHTYADTSLARADLGFAPAVGSRKGSRPNIAWLAEYCDRHTHRSSPLRRLVAVARGARDGAACASRTAAAPCRRARPSPTSSCSTRAPRRSNDKKWLTAREFFKQVTETYTQSPYRPDAKLGIGDTYLGEGIARSAASSRSTSSRSSCRSIRPTARADYAQFKLAMAHFRQMRAPQRDQTETREAIKEFETFVERYPNSS